MSSIVLRSEIYQSSRSSSLKYNQFLDKAHNQNNPRNTTATTYQKYKDHHKPNKTSSEHQSSKFSLNTKSKSHQRLL